MSLIESALLLYAAGLCLGYVACVVASLGFYRRTSPEGSVEPFTLIKPIKGLDHELERNLRAILEADRQGALQVLFALEGEDDAAYPVAARVAGAYPGRDVSVVLTGASGGRMGKIHNMIEALKSARHPYVVFSDADIRIDRAVLLETSAAFRQGADAVYATPMSRPGPRIADFMIAAAMNHFFAVAGALAYRVGLFHSFSGGWMGFRRDLLRKLDDLVPFERNIVDDFSIGMAARARKARIVLIRRVVTTREEGDTPREAWRHLFKWLKVVRHAVLPAYLLIPFTNSVFVAALAALIVGGPAIPLFGAAVGMRTAGAFLQDAALCGPHPRWMYLALPLVDLFQVLPWAAALFTRTVHWRGKDYRLSKGGRVEVLSR